MEIIVDEFLEHVESGVELEKINLGHLVCFGRLHGQLDKTITYSDARTSRFLS